MHAEDSGGAGELEAIREESEQVQKANEILLAKYRRQQSITEEVQTQLAKQKMENAALQNALVQVRSSFEHM
jgi:predicted nuclease with TOPRIM domain